MAYRVMVNGEQHGEIVEGDGLDAQLAVLNAAVDVIEVPDDLRKLFMFQLANGKYSEDSNGRRIWIEAVP